MFPLRDDNPTELTPWVTLLLVGVCALVWIGIQGAGFDASALEGSVCRFGAIPAEITGGAGGGLQGPCSPGGLTWEALVTSMFLHGGWAHLIGNLWFLWIFGNNVEDSMGHGRFLLFYLLCGLAAAGAHVVADPSSGLPMVGASGAISGIMGAYLLLYPRARVKTLLVLVVLLTVVELPAWVYLGYWFFLQVGSSALQPSGAGGGVAFMAHIGGFLAGLALVLPFRNPTLVDAKRSRVKIDPGELRGRGWW